MDRLDFEKINEIKALEDSIRSFEGFDAEKNSSARLKYLIVGFTIFVASLIEGNKGAIHVRAAIKAAIKVPSMLVESLQILNLD